MSTAAPHKTAIQRWSLSRPVALALEDGLLSTKTTFFDYGCGRGGDLKRLHRMGVPVSGWDPAFFPDEDRTPADVVNLGYVVNVIEDPEERAVALCAAWELTQKLLIVSARLGWEARTVAGDFCGDGIVTAKRTFQKFFAQDELRGWIESTIGRSPVAAAPGVFYVFRDAAAEQTFLARRATRPRDVPAVRFTDDLFRERQDVLQPLIDFMSLHGRLPAETELDVDNVGAIVEAFGSIPRAFSLVRRVTSAQQWEAVRQTRRDDLLVYLALAAFRKRPRLGDLPDRLRYDIRAFFSSYKSACAEADRLLFSAGEQGAVDRACGKAPVGKVLPGALYIHHSALGHLAPLLRVYEGCGRQLAGAIDGVTLVKLSRRWPRISYLAYPDFDRVGHPALAEAFIADLRKLTLDRRDYRRGPNPPVLHRKELFVSGGYPGRARFARLTEQEEKAGLYDYEGDIGRDKQWRMLLERTSVAIRGHRLVRVASREPKSLGGVSISPSELDAAPEDDKPRRSTAPSLLPRATTVRKERPVGRPS